MKNFLYHGSAYNNKGKPLVPGIVHSGEEIFWDGKFESNRYLYVTDNAVNAILLGIGSLTEKEIKTNGFRYDLDGNDVFFMFEQEDMMTEKELETALKGKVIYLYTIKQKKQHGWMENSNPQNNIDGEFKTNRAIPATDYAMAEVEILQWMTKNKWKMVTRLRDTSSSQKAMPTL